MNKALPLLSGVLLFVSAAKAQPQVTATISAESIGSESYDYTVTVDNGSAYSYDAIWFSFLPHLENFLPSKPTSVTPPSGWEGTITSSSDGYGIEFLPLNNSITPLLPNSSVIFSFDSPDLPSVIAETWMDPKSPPDATWLFGSGGVDVEPYTWVVPQYVQAVPEPSSLGLVLTGLGGLWLRRQRR
jgi:hypothetical protein